MTGEVKLALIYSVDSAVHVTILSLQKRVTRQFCRLKLPLQPQVCTFAAVLNIHLLQKRETVLSLYSYFYFDGFAVSLCLQLHLNVHFVATNVPSATPIYVNVHFIATNVHSAELIYLLLQFLNYG